MASILTWFQPSASPASCIQNPAPHPMLPSHPGSVVTSFGKPSHLSKQVRTPDCLHHTMLFSFTALKTILVNDLWDSMIHVCHPPQDYKLHNGFFSPYGLFSITSVV